MFSRSQIKEIAKEIWELNDEIIELESFCETKLRELYPAITDLQVPEVLDEFLPKIKSLIDKRIASSRDRGIPPNYEFDNRLPNTLRSYSSKCENNYLTRKYRKEIKAAISSMDWKSFEHFCKHILEINRIISASVTQVVKEGGIDFYGLLDMGEYIPTVLFKNVRLRIIGQAKHHSGDEKVGEGEIRKFKTHYSDFQSGKGRGMEALPEWFTEMRTPVIGMLVTNTDFTGDAEKFAEENGIILRDGDQITEDIIHSPRSNEWFHTGKDGNRIFNQQLFLRSFSAI
jgi:hypothetical protein